MGDRGNIVVRQKDGEPFIFLYSHWGGSELPEILSNVLKREERWDDPPYLTRMIFSEMIFESVRSATGYGIALYPCDNEHDFLVVDCPRQRVLRVDSHWDGGWNQDGKLVEEIPIKAQWPFKEFINRKLALRDF